MKGLLIRNLYLNKKSIVLMAIMTIMLYLNTYETENAENLLFLNVTNFIIVLITSSIGEPLAIKDDKNGWNKYIYACPISNKTIVAEKYILQIIFLCIGIVFSLILTLLYNNYFNIKLTLAEFSGIIICTIIVLLNSAVHIPLEYKFGQKFASIISSIIIICFLTCTFILFFNNIYIGTSFFLANNILFIMSIFAYILSYKISTKCFNRYIE